MMSHAVERNLHNVFNIVNEVIIPYILNSGVWTCKELPSYYLAG